MTLLLISLSGIASAHILYRDHGLAETLWHQLAGSHHWPLTLGLLAGSLLGFVIGRWIVNYNG
jgi:uncharacterized membrane protein YfcA